MRRYEHLAGTVFPTGSYTPAPHHVRLWADAVGSDPDFAFPLGAASMVAARGGPSIGAVMALLEAEPERTLFGELGFEFAAPLAAGRTYAVESELVAVERKRGRRVPCFDLVRLVARIAEEHSGELAATVEQAWVVSRDGE